MGSLKPSCLDLASQPVTGLRYYAVGERKKDRVITRGLIDPPSMIGKSKWNLTSFNDLVFVTSTRFIKLVPPKYIFC